ncbi:MAG: VWA domain-containing protein, partial [Treponema sp.]|nr:VWA domain-containing protein [Treponema sp.]
DYRRDFRDNPFILQVTQKIPEVPPEGILPDAMDTFKNIATMGHGNLVYSTASDLVDKIRAILEKERGNALDLVLCLDTTGSMKNKIDAVKRMLIPMLEGVISEFPSFRIGMMLYKDYGQEYLNKAIPFTRDFKAFQRTLRAVGVGGGGSEIPEAVYEALYAGAVQFPWEAESRLMILIGDAPPHPEQRGEISKEMVDQAVAERGIKVYAILLPQ